MDREYVLTFLLFTTIGLALWLGARIGGPTQEGRSARALEAQCWRALWTPLAPVSVVVAAVLGWYAFEPDDSVLVPRTLMAWSAVVALVAVRAASRAVRSAWPRETRTIATTGLWHPRVRMSMALRRALDGRALAAAAAHEAAHVRHRDPLRIWCAQLITDLQWPSASARRRLDTWRHALELARDEEARAFGADGTDLAAAILATARYRVAERAAACLISAGAAGLQDRIDRLLRPAPADSGCEHTRQTYLGSTGPRVIAAAVSGAVFGHTIVCFVCRALP
jgi:hypothetical protein